LLDNFAKYFDFLGTFRKNLYFFRQFPPNNQFFNAHLSRILIFRQFHKKFDFLGKFPKKFDFVSGNFTRNRLFRANLRKILIFSGYSIQNSDFSGKISEKYRFSTQNWLFTAISGQIILFLFKSHHF